MYVNFYFNITATRCNDADGSTLNSLIRALAFQKAKNHGRRTELIGSIPRE